jgi:competence protein ComEA
MQTKPLDALRLWWRDINFTKNQRKALAGVAIISISLSALFIFRSHPAEADPVTSGIVPKLVAPPLVIVDVAGEVNKPGVYELAPNARVIDALKAAGGASKSADLSLINLARVIKDGEQIYIEKKWTGNSTFRRSSNSGIINVNRASAKELDRLPGIGPVLAARIIEYRSANGPFTSIDDLKKVSGIGGSTLEKFKSKIRV